MSVFLSVVQSGCHLTSYMAYSLNWCHYTLLSLVNTILLEKWYFWFLFRSHTGRCSELKALFSRITPRLRRSYGGAWD